MLLVLRSPCREIATTGDACCAPGLTAPVMAHQGRRRLFSKRFDGYSAAAVLTLPSASVCQLLPGQFFWSVPRLEPLRNESSQDGVCQLVRTLKPSQTLRHNSYNPNTLSAAIYTLKRYGMPCVRRRRFCAISPATLKFPKTLQLPELPARCCN